MAALGPTTAAFRPLLRRFWRLVPALQAEFSRFEREVLRPTSQPPTHIVALQVRAGHLVRPRSEEATFYRCAQQLGNLAGMGLGGERGQAWGGGELGARQALEALEAALLPAGQQQGAAAAPLPGPTGGAAVPGGGARGGGGAAVGGRGERAAPSTPPRRCSSSLHFAL